MGKAKAVDFDKDLTDKQKEALGKMYMKETGNTEIKAKNGKYLTAFRTWAVENASKVEKKEEAKPTKAEKEKAEKEEAKKKKAEKDKAKKEEAKKKKEAEAKKKKAEKEKAEKKDKPEGKEDAPKKEGHKRTSYWIPDLVIKEIMKATLNKGEKKYSLARGSTDAIRTKLNGQISEFASLTSRIVKKFNRKTLEPEDVLMVCFNERVYPGQCPDYHKRCIKDLGDQGIKKRNARRKHIIGLDPIKKTLSKHPSFKNITRISKGALEHSAEFLVSQIIYLLRTAQYKTLEMNRPPVRLSPALFETDMPSLSVEFT
jgi:flagellar biosynthesis GTPase FlhF